MSGVVISFLKKSAHKYFDFENFVKRSMLWTSFSRALFLLDPISSYRKEYLT